MIRGAMATHVPWPTPAMDRALALFEPARRPAEPSFQAGYLDLLGEEYTSPRDPSQRAMESRLVPLIYERFWRPFLARMLMGAKSPGTHGEHRLVLDMLSLSHGEQVLDVACGPGNFTRDFALAVDDGLVVGIDVSGTMLALSARTAASANTAYIRADACTLPFRDESFDAICCFGALHLFKEPWRAIDELVRVLAPDGRVALLVVAAKLDPGRQLRMVQRVGPLLVGCRPFARNEIPQALRDRGLTDVEKRVAGLGQFLSARKHAP
jgi:ubiquinone/menaquinone biosynthesis C-methylase UbiE